MNNIIYNDITEMRGYADDIIDQVRKPDDHDPDFEEFYDDLIDDLEKFGHTFVECVWNEMGAWEVQETIPNKDDAKKIIQGYKEHMLRITGDAETFGWTHFDDQMLDATWDKYGDRVIKVQDCSFADMAHFYFKLDNRDLVDFYDSSAFDDIDDTSVWHEAYIKH